jgi:hypothetical protein
MSFHHRPKEGATTMVATNWTRNFVARVRVTDDPVGDLVADMRRDPGVLPLFHSRTAVVDLSATSQRVRCHAPSI